MYWIGLIAGLGVLVALLALVARSRGARRANPRKRARSGGGGYSGDSAVYSDGGWGGDSGGSDSGGWGGGDSGGGGGDSGGGGGGD
ncbi:uncharacterized protein SAMN02982929_04155 [Saccharopolyspora kobensis]|uniref:Uncharacterized protein n=2 Tax=Saccharopolyspora kobensis TaxID=146035 RepID=A0A1H6DCI0_9PSEU|nr:hypothetical protein [Saccharopolyspora kobensis]SEG82832.1 uncharacterized protein SAMN02982929_04155 [Saccharopolyspora kobensis]SFE26590.1 uncharacterized protein SAMN05216506_11072 [Saccharopolyspora kobensis]